ncbi:JmjC domain, hydroxylase-domain-containing protein, partial [Kickxella alabastrina]|uniref:JmjC domain, hydroxylase-domain-containing protein n=1 Tax=Kickxella alabastrina TaxID=61397 RepID=UPI0022212612
MRKATNSLPRAAASSSHSSSAHKTSLPPNRSTGPSSTQHQQHQQQQFSASDADAASIFYPELFGQAIEYYFYPNSSVPVFCPSTEQFSDFEALVSAIEPLALRAGICKIVPPTQWRDELEGSAGVRVFDEEDFPILKPIVQHFNGNSGIFHQYNVEFHRKVKLAQFFQTSQDASHRVPEHKAGAEDNSSRGDKAHKKQQSAEPAYAENEELERMYWKNLLFQPPMYGADVLGTLFPPVEDFPTWNIRRLPGLLRRIDQRMPGVNDPYLYLGMWKATFAWHVEDMDLYSINYIHFGSPKAWYAIPVEARARFEMSMQNVFAGDHKLCSQFLRHKAFLLSPRFLASQGIPFNRVVQRAGEIILTFPLGYHAGFNHGFNCAESVNFAIDRWLEVAPLSRHCECVKDSVTIDL